MPADATLALAFGKSLKRCDMVVFESDISSPKMTDCFFEKDDLEHVDAHQDWFAEYTDYGSRHQKLFTARRALDTSDADDFAFQLDR